MSDLTLTEDELVTLTRRKQPCAQARVLAQLGVPFQRHPVDGHCVVWRHDVARRTAQNDDNPHIQWQAA